MIKVSVLYPSGNGNQFDMDYYCNQHIPMVSGLLGDAVKAATIEKGVSGGAPQSLPPYLAMGNMYFDTVESFEKSFGSNVEAIMAELPNFTNATPQVQISEVMV